MAGNAADEVCSEKFSFEFLTCSLCLDRYRNPKVLPCQHTFCLQCLKNYVATISYDAISLPCPMCKEVTLIPQRDPACFRNNYHIISLLQYVEDKKAKLSAMEDSSAQPSSSTSSSMSAMCHACNENRTLNSYCSECNLWLCHICSKAHERVPATCNHNIRSLDTIDKECKEMAAIGEKTVLEYKVVNEENCDILQKQLMHLPEMVQEVKSKVEQAGQVASKVIQDKQADILARLDRFYQDQMGKLTVQLDSIKAQKRDLTKIQELLTAVKIIDDAYSNQAAVKQIDQQLRTVTPVNEMPQSVGESLSISFAPYTPHLSELRNMDIGLLIIGQKKPAVPQLLHDHKLRTVKGVCLKEREYISGLAVNKFADKFVVSKNESVFVFKPDSSAPKQFLSAESSYVFCKPWGIAFSDVDQELYITEAGEYEGKGSVTVFTLDGKVKNVFASGLTLPRGIAAHNGYIFVCDQIDKCVYIFNKRGKIHKVLKKTPDGKFLFVNPMFVSVGVNGNFAITDNFNCVKIFDRHYSLLYEYWPSFTNTELWGVLMLRDGSTVVCDWKQGLHQISPDFQTTGLIAVEGTTLKEPSAIAALENGTMFYVGSCTGEVFHVI